MKNLILASLLFLAACSASGPQYSTLDGSITKASTGNGKIILYREHIPLNVSTYWVELNGIEVCDLHQGSFLIHEIPAGTTNISSSHFGSPGTSRMPITVKAGQTVYVKMITNQHRAIAGIFGGYIGEAIDEGTDDQSGPVYLGQVSKETATQDMASMNMDCQ